MISIKIQLTPDDVTTLMRDVVGQGGFQSLLRSLQTQVEDGELRLFPDQIERIARYVQHYGGGGFQGRLNPVLEWLNWIAKTVQG